MKLNRKLLCVSTVSMAQNMRRSGGSAIDARTSLHAGYEIGQIKRQMAERVHAWPKTWSTMRRAMVRGLDRMKAQYPLALTVFCLFTTGAVYAKLPAQPMTDEQKAKAVETKAKAAAAARKEAGLLAKSQDRVADRYIKAQKAKGVVVKPTPIAAAIAADSVKASKAAKTVKAAKAPLLEKLMCRTGPNDRQARLIVEVVKGRLMEFAYYTRFGTGVCSIHGRRGDAYTKWEDGADGNVAVKLLTGNARAEYKPGRVLIKFSDVDRMPYCGMFGELNGSIEVMKKKSECGLKGVFDRMGDG